MAKYWRDNRRQWKRSSTVTLVLFMLLMQTLMLLMLLGHGIFSFNIDSGDDSIRTTLDTLGKREDKWTEIVSWEPRAFVYHNFLSKEECEHLINLAKPHMTKSTVIDDETGDNVDSEVRTSTGMFLRRGQDKVITAIEKRIADYTFIPVENGEDLQVLHYDVGQKYEPHHDFFDDESNLKNVGQRVATVLIYLSDVEEGGETVFPDAKKGNISSGRRLNTKMSECAERGVSVKPKMGDALLFWSLRPDTSEDISSLHGSCPVIKGNKWSCTKWLHLDEF
ncbi:putative prolyl 4-hydroxylase 3 [Castilleja foliolosa]|uniref:procollagen-proline 4-dioxygenase n=1 Tax=Castilleja foliolosa TaxID=1961234 RepID=A0ABD3DIU2_9LAMI